MNHEVMTTCMQPSFEELRSLFSRSHTFMLLEDYVKTHDVPAPKKMDFTTLAKAQDDFEHLCEVFEQDLRLGEETDVVKWCKDSGHESVLRSALWFLLKKTHDDPSKVIAAKAVMVSDEEKERASGW